MLSLFCLCFGKKDLVDVNSACLVPRYRKYNEMYIPNAEECHD
jgi:hypothetical protein